MQLDDKDRIALWSRYEDVTVHFNDLIMRLRTHALTGIAGVVTVSGLAVNFTGGTNAAPQWIVLVFAFVFLAIAWIALWVLDVGYYDKLLRGAIDALIAIESATQTDVPESEWPAKSIILSTKIRAKAGEHTRTVNWFYGLVLGGLGLGIIFALTISQRTQPTANEKLQYQLESSGDERVHLSVEPAISAKQEASPPVESNAEKKVEASGS